MSDISKIYKRKQPINEDTDSIHIESDFEESDEEAPLSIPIPNPKKQKLTAKQKKELLALQQPPRAVPTTTITKAQESPMSNITSAASLAAAAAALQQQSFQRSAQQSQKGKKKTPNPVNEFKPNQPKPPKFTKAKNPAFDLKFVSGNEEKSAPMENIIQIGNSPKEGTETRGIVMGIIGGKKIGITKFWLGKDGQTYYGYCNVEISPENVFALNWGAKRTAGIIENKI